MLEEFVGGDVEPRLAVVDRQIGPLVDLIQHVGQGRRVGVPIHAGHRRLDAADAYLVALVLIVGGGGAGQRILRAHRRAVEPARAILPALRTRERREQQDDDERETTHRDSPLRRLK